MRAVVLGGAGLLGGFLAGWVGTAALLIALGGLLGANNREGAYDMGAAFVFGPMGGIAGAILGLWLGLRRARRVPPDRG
jgi:hypothetical protein